MDLHESHFSEVRLSGLYLNFLQKIFHIFQNRRKPEPKVTSAPDYRGDRPGPGTGEVFPEVIFC